MSDTPYVVAASVVGAIAFYTFFLREDPELTQMRDECKKLGTTVERRPNAIQFFGHRNYHYACRGYDIWGNKKGAGV